MKFEAWMTTEILQHWFTFHFLEEIKEQYGDTQVILMLDNAGPHPTDLGDDQEQVNVMYLPANTTPLIQPMDQGIIYTLKYGFMKLYYNRILQYVMQNPTEEDPLVPFMKTYTIYDAIKDIGTSWDNIGTQISHKCFEPILDTTKFMKAYNEKHRTASEWPGHSFRGFQVGVADDHTQRTLVMIRTRLMLCIYLPIRHH